MHPISRFFTILAACLLPAYHGLCQSNPVSSGPDPIGGINKLVLEYYRINFTKDQRKTLEDIEIEFIYSIDQNGIPTLEEISGVSDKIIRDSLQQVTGKLPRFNPRTVNGKPESSLFLMKIRFPTYGAPANLTTTQEVYHYQEADMEDFEYIHKSGKRLDVVFGGIANTFLGRPGQYLAPGGGMKTEIMVIGKKGLGAGLVMSFYGNKLRQNYPLANPREQNTAPPTLLIGLGANKALLKKERKEFNLQAELNLAVQNLVPPLEGTREGGVQLRGFSPALAGNYLMQLGKSKTAYYYGAPSILTHALNFHAAIRPVFFNLKEATGIMAELGISYRMGYHSVDAYKLRAEPN